MPEFKVDRPVHFNLSDILDSGQAFMYSEYEDGFLIITKGKRAFVKELPSENKILFRVPDEKSLEIFKNYFDFSHNYEEDFKRLYELGFPEDVLSFSNGIRILNQDAEEIIFTFIISQNNNIKRIKKITRALTERVGKKCVDEYGEYFAFPDAKAISTLSIEDFKEMGAGYRDSYLYHTSNFLNENPNFLGEVAELETPLARKKLLTLKGVGPKVADCILLFGFNKRDVFPLDTWMEKVFHERFDKNEKNRVRMATKGAEEFGELAGLAQQLYFYHIRRKEK